MGQKGQNPTVNIESIDLRLSAFREVNIECRGQVERTRPPRLAGLSGDVDSPMKKPSPRPVEHLVPPGSFDRIGSS
jgi:hypothetical protein